MIGSLENRVKRNTPLAKDNGMMAVYEAITNAIQAINEAKRDDGKIVVSINCSSQKGLTDEKTVNVIHDIEIIDNGIGFTKENLTSFEQLDSEYKQKMGCHGIGRLMYLKVFEYATLTSVYKEKGKRFSRIIRFDFKNEVTVETFEETEDCEIKTCVKLHALKQDYARGFPKTLRTFSKRILEHFYAYFFSDTPPSIEVVMGNETYSLSDLLDQQELQNIQHERFELNSHDFEITHVRKRESTQKPKIHFLADSREVLTKETNIKGLVKTLTDSDGGFSYACYVSSPYLDVNTNSERGDFVLPKESDMFSLSLSDITSRIEACIESNLESELKAQIAKQVLGIKTHIRQYSPEYALLLTKLDDDKLYGEIDVGDRKKVDLFLHKLQYDLEKEAIEKGQKLKEQSADKNFDEKVQQYMQDVEDVQKMDLASYVCHRKVIIDTLSDLLRQNETAERDFHNLIFRQRSHEASSSNLWLIDDEFIYFNGVSEIPLRDLSYKEELLISESLTAEQESFLLEREGQLKDLQRPDILLFPDECKCIILELKDTDVRIEEYLHQIKIYSSIIFNCSEFPISKFYGLLVGENFREVDIRSVNADYKYSEMHRSYIEHEGRGSPIPDLVGMGKKEGVIYNRILKYSDILQLAKVRNQAFFEKLGLPQ